MKLPLIVLAALALAACEPPTGSGKPDIPELAAGATVEGVVAPGASAAYEVVAPDAEFRILLRARSGRAADTLVAELLDRSGTVITAVRSVGSDTSANGQASVWMAPTDEKRRIIRVRGHGADDGGAYSLLVFARDPAPEAIPQAITLGQVVDGEALDVEGDVDEFTVQGTAGQEWIVFAASPAYLDVQLVAPVTDAVVTTTSTATRSAVVEENSSGRVVLPATGTYRVRVAARFEQPGLTPYRLRVDAVNRAPESGSAALAPGAIAEEAIGSVGDVDEFTFSAPAGQEMNLFLQLRSALAERLTLQLLRNGEEVARLETAPSAAAQDEFATGRLTLAGGIYTVRIQGPVRGLPERTTAGYRLELYAIDRRPEAGGPLVLNGATASDAIERPGDIDEFVFQGTAGQRVVIHISGPPPVRGPITAQLVGPNTQLLPESPLHPVSVAVGSTATPAYARRMTLNETGPHRVRVGGEFTSSMGTGPYTVGVYTVSAAPEHVSATMQIGQSVTGERIDHPGDLDEFSLAGQAGREVALFLGADLTSGGMIARIETTGAAGFLPSIHAAGPSLDGASTGRIVLGDRPYTVVVDPQMFGSGAVSTTGGYGVRVLPINRAPEGRPAAYTLGDTVSGEPIYPAVDIDEYTFSVATPTTVRIFWSAQSTTPEDHVSALLVTDGSEHHVWNSRETFNDVLVREIRLAAGRYRLRVSDPNLGETARVTSNFTRSYRFAFVP
ncbi:hypothetical protein [Longimicrobium sp.]|jgi:hypothetical protein|uniref:hypothetical protein n=1 Tax=Longimicrobium sp. TaxID=2029185 RepID=UPI002ED7A731